MTIREEDPTSVLLLQLRAMKLPEPILEHKFGTTLGRLWRFDFCWPSHSVAFELEGGAFMLGGGRHTRGSGFREDCIKSAAATLLGWRVLHGLPEQVFTGECAYWIRKALLGGEIDRAYFATRVQKKKLGLKALNEGTNGRSLVDVRKPPGHAPVQRRRPNVPYPLHVVLAARGALGGQP